MTVPGVQSSLPRHIAIILDGNGRWATRRQLPRIAGHRAGVDNLRALVERSASLGIEYLTVFAFSSENWRRPQAEVRLLMELFVRALEQETRRLLENGIRLRVVGDRKAFPEKLQQAIGRAEQLTRENRRMTLVIAANYGGRWDLCEVTRLLAAQVAEGALQADAITPEMIAAHLAFGDIPDPDLFIRSGGEQRLSNFLLWQLAYTELYFTDCLWPDFGAGEFDLALASFARRERRFGMTGDQLGADWSRGQGRESA